MNRSHSVWVVLTHTLKFVSQSEGCLVQVCVTLKLLRLLFELGVELRRSDMDELHLKVMDLASHH